MATRAGTLRVNSPSDDNDIGFGGGSPGSSPSSPDDTDDTTDTTDTTSEPSDPAPEFDENAVEITSCYIGEEEIEEGDLEQILVKVRNDNEIDAEVTAEFLLGGAAVSTDSATIKAGQTGTLGSDEVTSDLSPGTYSIETRLISVEAGDSSGSIFG